MKYKFKPMECPVCNQYYFTEEFDECDLNDYCPQCGFKYDLYQIENPNIANLTNKLSLNDYKKWYEEKIASNPNYNYNESNYIATPHICPVCRKHQFKDVSSYEICPFCGWIDDELMESEPDDWAGGSNELSLNDYRDNYHSKISENPNYMWKK